MVLLICTVLFIGLFAPLLMSVDLLTETFICKPASFKTHFRTFSVKIKPYNLHECRVFARTDVRGCVTYCSGGLYINWQLFIEHKMTRKGKREPLKMIAGIIVCV